MTRGFASDTTDRQRDSVVGNEREQVPVDVAGAFAVAHQVDAPRFPRPPTIAHRPGDKPAQAGAERHRPQHQRPGPHPEPSGLHHRCLSGLNLRRSRLDESTWCAKKNRRNVWNVCRRCFCDSTEVAKNATGTTLSMFIHLRNVPARSILWLR